MTICDLNSLCKRGNIIYPIYFVLYEIFFCSNHNMKSFTRIPTSSTFNKRDYKVKSLLNTLSIMNSGILECELKHYIVNFLHR